MVGRLRGGLAAVAGTAGLAVLCVGPLTAVGISQASAASAPTVTKVAALRTPAALPSWQIDGVVWDTVTVGHTVYATGEFTTARPPGAKLGASSSVSRHNLLALDISTGIVTSFKHDLNGPGRAITASPDGKTVYVAGRFTSVDGSRRDHIAAFDTATGALTSFAPRIDGHVSAVAVSSLAVYLAGNFTHVNGVERVHLGAVSLDGATTQRWSPQTDGWVNAMVMAPGSQKVVLGGTFQAVNGQPRVGIGMVTAGTGKSQTWKSNPIPARKGTSSSAVTDLIVSGNTIFGTAEGTGHHWFDGQFAVSGVNGSLIWLANCYGATYSGYVSRKVFYTVGHAHDCSSVSGFPETDPRTYHRAIAQTTSAVGRDRTKPSTNSTISGQPVPGLVNWYPDLSPGGFTGKHQAAYAITGDGHYMVLAGEFLKVNGVAQQGLTRFAVL